MKFGIEIDGLEELVSKLDKLNSVRLDAVMLKQATETLNRARRNAATTEGGTPVDTRELLLSASMHKISDGYEVGYGAEYAPHVEYGHRTINGGYVQGQRFFQKNVQIQKEIYKKDLEKAIKKEMK